MASMCTLCGKKPSFGMSISHSHRRTKRRWNPNIQRVRARVGSTTKRIDVCTSCIKAGKVTKAVRWPSVNGSLPLAVGSVTGPAQATPRGAVECRV